MDVNGNGWYHIWNQCHYFSLKNINCLSINKNLIAATAGLVKLKPADNNKYNKTANECYKNIPFGGCFILFSICLS